MKTQTTQKPKSSMLVLIAIGLLALIIMAPASRAGLTGPYTNDFYTLHLWHLQDANGTVPGVATNGVYFNDSAINPLVVPLLISNTPGPDLINALSSPTNYAYAGQPGPGVPQAALYGTNFGYVFSIQNTQYTGFFAPWDNVGNNDYPDLSYAQTNGSCSFVNTNTGAFTWEALIQPNFNPLTDTADKNPEILCSDVFAQFTGDESNLDACREQFKNVFIPKQMAADGSFPRELARTKPYGYSTFQLDNMAVLCQILSTSRDNLWQFQLFDERGMRKAMEFMYPYFDNKNKWLADGRPKDVQAWECWPARESSLLFAGIAYGDQKYLNLWLKLPSDPTNAEVRRNIAITQPVLWIQN